MTIRFAEEPQPTGEIRTETLGWQKPNPSGGRRWVRRLWFCFGFLALAVVWVLVAMRWRSVSHPLTIATVGVMPLLAIGPLLCGLIGSWWSRSASLRVAAALTTGVFLFTTSPVDAVIGCGADERATSDSADVFTIYTANVWFENPGGQPDQIATAISAADPDIIFLQEVQWEFLAALESDPRLDVYDHRSTDTVGGRIQDLVWSRWPLQHTATIPLENTRLIEATIESPAGRFAVSPVHLQAPITRGDAGLWTRQLEALTAIDRSSPRILAGDFNATRDHQPFRSLLNSGWTDVHEKKGCGFDATWPVDRRLPFPVMRLDHVLVTDHFEVLDVRLGEPGGSDHLPVITTLRVDDQP